jgi:ADP-heptose:LPS heptosyltransferase
LRAENPRSILVLRNNDIGDLLIITPLFEALRKRFPEARIYAAIGGWNRPVLAGNPCVDEIVELNAPWHNKFATGGVAHNSVRGLMRSLRFIYGSDELARCRVEGFDVGIDVLGSPEGSLLLMRAGARWRMGVKGYAGGHSACHQWVEFRGDVQVGKAALGFAELLGCKVLPESRPQLFLNPAELDEAGLTWNGATRGSAQGAKRVLIAPGGGVLEKCWPREHYRELADLIVRRTGHRCIVVGSRGEHGLGEFVRNDNPWITNLCGETTMRAAFALASASDVVVCNSSMMLHVAAAARKPTVVLLGRSFPSAIAHKALWGYESGDIHCGPEPGRRQVFAPEEAFAVLQRALVVQQ